MTTILTVSEVATILQTNKAYVYKLISSGLLPHIKLGSIKVREVALDEFLAKYEGTDPFDTTVTS